MAFRINLEPFGMADVALSEWLKEKQDKRVDIHADQAVFLCESNPILEIAARMPGLSSTRVFQDLGFDRDTHSGRVVAGILLSDDLAINLRKHSSSRADIEYWGTPEAVEQARTVFAEFPPFERATVEWWYRSPHGHTSQKLVLDNLTTLTPEMYPGMPFCGDPIEYMNKYYEDSASILFLLGPPGTGKTSLIRRFLVENNLTAFVTYDEAILNDDGMFLSFINNKQADILVLEDVTELLHKRELDKNAMMARFLNVSDGLVQMPRKKIIFTTNLHNLSGIDEALLRPGRCYDIAELRPLSYDEAKKACAAADLPIPLKHKEYLMSELYNQKDTPEAVKLGIIA